MQDKEHKIRLKIEWNKIKRLITNYKHEYMSVTARNQQLHTNYLYVDVNSNSQDFFRKLM
jgi:hypothetical protein